MSSKFTAHRQQNVRSAAKAPKSCHDNFHCLKNSESGVPGRMIPGVSMSGVSAENVCRSDNVGNVVHRSDSLRSFAVPMSSLSSSDATSTFNQFPPQQKSHSHHQLSFEANKMSANAHNGVFTSISDSKPAKYICSNVIEPKIILYSANTAPKFLLHNYFIWTGYRAFLPYRLCLKSVFIWSNETINIWTHLIGWMFFFTLMLYDNLVVLPQFKKHVAIMEFIIGNVSLLCFQICMAMSVGFHVFGCHSEKMCQHWLGWDLTGISAAILGCYLPGIYYAFYCFPIWRDIYLAIVLLILVITLFLPIFLRDYLVFSHFGSVYT